MGIYATNSELPRRSETTTSRNPPPRDAGVRYWIPASPVSDDAGPGIAENDGETMIFEGTFYGILTEAPARGNTIICFP